MDHEDDHNGLLSKEILKKNMIDTEITISHLQAQVESDNSASKVGKPEKAGKAGKVGKSGDVKDVEIKKSIWLSKEANSMDFKFQVYAQRICPIGCVVVKEEGLHKRSVHWVPSVQVVGAPENGIFRLEKIKKVRKVKKTIDEYDQIAVYFPTR